MVRIILSTLSKKPIHAMPSEKKNLQNTHPGYTVKLFLHLFGYPVEDVTKRRIIEYWISWNPTEIVILPKALKEFMKRVSKVSWEPYCVLRDIAAWSPTTCKILLTGINSTGGQSSKFVILYGYCPRYGWWNYRQRFILIIILDSPPSLKNPCPV